MLINPPEDELTVIATPDPRETVGGSVKMYDVTMNTYKRVDILKDDPNTYVVKTVGVNGCDAILVWKSNPDSGDEILLTHYPPSEVEQHRKVLRDFSPQGDGVAKVAYLTMGRENDDWVMKLKDEIEKVLKVKPEVVSLAGLPSDSIRAMQHDSTLYQLCATKGYNGNLNARRIIIPFPDRNIYESQF